MRKIFLSLFCLGLVMLFNEAEAQTTQSAGTSKDEYWGTAKATVPGATADAVGAREAQFDKRLNTYDGQRRTPFGKTRFKTKKMKEIEKNEKKMLRKRDKERRRLARSR